MWSLGQFLSTWMALCVIPYGMYAIALLCESRLPGDGPDRVPIWTNQSRAFVPGDALLMLSVTCGWFMFSQGIKPWFESVAGRVTLGLIGLVISLVALYAGRNVTYDSDSYSKQAWDSPSKCYHDWVMFFAFPLVAVWVVVPGYASQWNDDNAFVITAGFAGVLGWACLLFWDNRQGSPVPNDRQHPSEYMDIFMTFRVWLAVRQYMREQAA